MDNDPYCFICSRCTDHVAEHDALVDAGLAEYNYYDGSVFKTDLWDAALAREISDAEYEGTYVWQHQAV